MRVRDPKTTALIFASGKIQSTCSFGYLIQAYKCCVLEEGYFLGVHGDFVVAVIAADVLEYYDQTVNSPSGCFYIPAVLRIPHFLQVVKRRRVKITLSRKNILAQDNFTRQYCSSTENLTIDHVYLIAQGGDRTWENLVAACSRCNSRKGRKTLEEANMRLNKVPKAPKDYDIVAIPLINTAIQTPRRKGTPEVAGVPRVAHHLDQVWKLDSVFHCGCKHLTIRCNEKISCTI